VFYAEKPRVPLPTQYDSFIQNVPAVIQALARFDTSAADSKSRSLFGLVWLMLPLSVEESRYHTSRLMSLTIGWFIMISG